MVRDPASIPFVLDEVPEKKLMQVALRAARWAYRRNEVPVGAAIFDQRYRLVAVAHNRVEHNVNALAHAEVLVIQRAMRRLEEKYLTACGLVTSLEPCSFCASAIREARLPLLVYGAHDEKAGSVENGLQLYHHTHVRPPPYVISGVMADESAYLLRAFFKIRRNTP